MVKAARRVSLMCLRAIIYSYLTLTNLMQKISKLSKNDRALLVEPKDQERYLTQKRHLRILLSQNEFIDIDNLEYLMQLANWISLEHQQLTKSESLILQNAHKFLQLCDAQKRVIH